MKVFFKVFSLIFSLFFLWAGIMQYNDPDALIWIVIYLLAALGSMLFFFNRFPRILCWIFVVLSLVGAILFWPEKFQGVTIGQGDIENIERGREALGLLLVGLVFLILSFRAPKKG